MEDDRNRQAVSLTLLDCPHFTSKTLPLFIKSKSRMILNSIQICQKSLLTNSLQKNFFTSSKVIPTRPR